ncbi:MAG TPA: glycoside hydrolase family 25 protein [Rubrobacter sp.]
MSIDQPIYGVDISDYQRGIDLAQVAREGYEFCVVKASEGPYGDGTSYLNPSFGTQIDGARRAGLLTGAYHFLVETPATAQVDLFLETVGDVSGKLVMVDYEGYPHSPSLSPSEATLRAFVTELRQRIGNHPILVYAGQGYWNSPPANGSIVDLGVTTWDAFYPLHPLAGFGSVLYERVKRQGWGERWGNQEPEFWQFSANGLVAGMEIDVNAFSGTREELYSLAEAEPPDVQPAADVNVARPLVPPGFVPLAVQPNSPNYQARHPTRYQWRDDVEDQIRRIYDVFPNVHINTYVDHPEGFRRDRDSFDVWGPGGRNDPIGFDRGQRVFEFVFNDPNPPLIEWCIWRRAIWTRASGQFEPFGTNPFTFHDDHSHWTFERP